ncbi:MAG: DUF4037 domain-containing protein [Gammaproteobacteria bacterium]|nr:DUF4037 domain-containing protein [Gammaproteobacteria bacterium]
MAHGGDFGPLNDPDETGGLEYSRRLFEIHGRTFLERLGLLDVCSVACVGGTSQNAALDDSMSRDHMWGPYLTFLLPDSAWRLHGRQLKRALKRLPDRVEDVEWRGYDGPEPRRTDAHEILGFLHRLTGYRTLPKRDVDWLAYLNAQSFLGRRWSERMFDAGQGAVFHDPDDQFDDLWRRFVRYPPPDIQRALLARSLFRAWNAGPEYNLTRAWQRGDLATYSQCRSRFVDEVVEAAFCWNKSYVPAFKWRLAHFDLLPDCPVSVREGVATLAIHPLTDGVLAVADTVVHGIKQLVSDRFQVSAGDQPLSTYAHAIHGGIVDRAIREATSLDW